MTRVAGLVLAAGAGSRLGMPKAVVVDDDGRTWLARSVDALIDAGVDEVIAVVGAHARQARSAAPATVRVIEAVDWHEGMAASLRAGMRALADQSGATAVVVMLVDTPDVGPDVVRRLAGHAAPGTLARATYSGRPGHPVLIGREHWLGVIATVTGDTGARAYLADHDTVQVECGDLAVGADIDTPEALDLWRGTAPDDHEADDSAPPESAPS